jgi:hypothetical protein
LKYAFESPTERALARARSKGHDHCQRYSSPDEVAPRVLIKPPGGGAVFSTVATKQP